MLDHLYTYGYFYWTHMKTGLTPPCTRHAVEALRKIGLDCNSLLVLRVAQSCRTPAAEHVLFLYEERLLRQVCSAPCTDRVTEKVWAWISLKTNWKSTAPSSRRLSSGRPRGWHDMLRAGLLWWASCLAIACSGWSRVDEDKLGLKYNSPNDARSRWAVSRRFEPMTVRWDDVSSALPLKRRPSWSGSLHTAFLSLSLGVLMRVIVHPSPSVWHIDMLLAAYASITRLYSWSARASFHQRATVQRYYPSLCVGCGWVYFTLMPKAGLLAAVPAACFPFFSTSRFVSYVGGLLKINRSLYVGFFFLVLFVYNGSRSNHICIHVSKLCTGSIISRHI